jgi:hypothetical protein
VRGFGCHLIVVARDHHNRLGPLGENVQGVDEGLHRQGAARMPEVAKENDAGVA